MKDEGKDIGNATCSTCQERPRRWTRLRAQVHVHQHGHTVTFEHDGHTTEYSPADHTDTQE